VYTDFLSMYPTVNSLMDLWRLVTAEEIQVVEHCHASIEAFLGQLSSKQLFDPATWRNLTGIVQVIPNGDILPSRCKYNPETNDWQVGLNYLYSENDDPKNALWFSLPDVVASVLLKKGRIPREANTDPAARLDRSGPSTAGFFSRCDRTARPLVAPFRSYASRKRSVEQSAQSLSECS